MMRAYCALCGCLAIANAAYAGSLNIVATGDSNTTGYAPIRLTLAMQSQGISGTGYSIASGGATAPLYVGKQLDTNHKPEPAYHNQAEEAINGPVYGFGPPWTYGSVIAKNPEPDAVIVMLGTNDAIQAAAGNYLAWPTYQAEMAGVYQYLMTAVTPGGKRPDIFIATPIPLLAPQYAAADAFITSTMIPWIKDQITNLQAQGLPVHLVDVNYDIRQQPDWQTWYSDGIHLFSGNQAGYEWLAREMLFAVLDQHLGDANLDGIVNGLDYTAWADHFGASGGSGNWSQGDFNHDGVVDGLDYVLWADHFSAVGAATTTVALVPEPSSLTIAGLGGLFLAAAAWRSRHTVRRRCFPL